MPGQNVNWSVGTLYGFGIGIAIISGHIYATRHRINTFIMGEILINIVSH